MPDWVRCIRWFLGVFRLVVWPIGSRMRGRLWWYVRKKSVAVRGICPAGPWSKKPWIYWRPSRLIPFVNSLFMVAMIPCRRCVLTPRFNRGIGMVSGNEPLPDPSPVGWMPKPPFLFYIHPVQQGSPKEFCIPPVVTWFIRPIPLRKFFERHLVMCFGALRISVGSRVTVTWLTDLCFRERRW